MLRPENCLTAIFFKKKLIGKSLLRANPPLHPPYTLHSHNFFFWVYPPNTNPAFGLGHFPSFPHRFLIETDRLIANTEASRERTKTGYEKSRSWKGLFSSGIRGAEKGKKVRFHLNSGGRLSGNRDERIPAAQQNSDFLTKQGCDGVLKKHKGSCFTVSTLSANCAVTRLTAFTFELKGDNRGEGTTDKNTTWQIWSPTGESAF